MQLDSVSPTSDSESQSTRALMKTLTFVSFVAASQFTMDVHASISAEPAFERPQVALAADTAALLGRAEHALLQYAKNCETGDHAAISHTLTDTAVIEYVTAQPERAVSAKESAEHLAMIEMDGLRIARIRDLTGSVKVMDPTNIALI